MVLALLLAGCGGEPRAAAAPVAPSGANPGLPNIVYVLTDDLSTDLLRYMPTVQRLAREGTSFSQFITSASLCCPSRASIFTGLLPHDTGVYTNIFPHGGIYAFARSGNADRTFAVTLNAQGYRTALMGKYLNGYRANSGAVPPGWTDFAGSAKGYTGFDYTLNLNGVPTAFGNEEFDYLTDVISDRGTQFIDESAVSGRPFFLELSTFTPHRPAVPAPRHADLFPDAQVPRTASFDREVIDAPPWLAGRESRGARAAHIDARYRKRAQSVVSVDEMLARVLEHLEANGQASNTYVVFGSDNGYHMGEHRLLPGKLTAFETDIRVPLIVRGPRVPAGATVDALVQNTDMAPTFEALAGGRPAADVDGRSLAGLIHGRPVPRDWRTAALIEHRHTARKANDPDEQTPASGDPPTYKAMRTRDATYVEYLDGEREYYDLRADPDELRNAFADLSVEQRARLSRRLRALVSCRGAALCATAPGSPAARNWGHPPRRQPRSPR